LQVLTPEIGKSMCMHLLKEPDPECP
jgi:hypothetical protein